MRDFDPTASEFISCGFLRYSRPDAPARRLHYDPVTIITAVAVGAAVGAVTAAITGGNILKGALFGAIGGGIASGISAAFGAASGAAGGTAGAASGVAGEALAGAGASAVPFEAGFVGTEAIGGAAGTGLGASGGIAGAEGAAAVPSTVGSGMEASIDSSMAAGNGGTGLSAPGVEAGVGGDTGLSAGVTPPNPFANDSGSFLDQLLNKGKGMLSSRFATGMAGNALSGYAQGKMQDAKLAEQRRLIEDQRANARFGNVGSRYGGMIYAPTTYK